mmetsp:Transcript_24449/g.62757  ORF Transcript_24449/g.62757 Transcript_24449/m.62757 type:complete len:365 (-) Transcript_24449:39-1133(-)
MQELRSLKSSNMAKRETAPIQVPQEVPPQTQSKTQLSAEATGESSTSWQQAPHHTGWAHDPDAGTAHEPDLEPLALPANEPSDSPLRQQMGGGAGLWFPAPVPQSAPPVSAMMGGRLMEGTSQHGFQTATNVTMKMLSMTPAGLPPDLRQHMEFLMEAVPADVQGAMRPGCVFMSVDMWFANQEQLDRAKAALQLNIDTGKADELFERTDMDLYSQSTGYKVRRGRVVERFANQESCSIANAGPVVCNPGLTEWRAVVSTSSPDARIRMVCRVKGRFFDVAAREEAQLPDGRFQYALRAPLDDNALGLAWLEIIETLPGGDEAVSLPHPMFLTTRSDMCQEMSSLFETACAATRRDMAGILKVK